MDSGTFSQLTAGLIYASAGACVFLVLLNRVLINRKDGWDKLVIVVGAAAVLVIGAGISGFALGLSRPIVLPAAVLVILALGEARRFVIRKRCAGSPPVAIDRRRFTKGSMITTTDLAVVRYQVECNGWPGDRLRVAHASDLHVTDSMPFEYYTGVMKAVEEARPDLVFFTGDFVTRVRFVSLLQQVLKSSNGCSARFAVLGNHDHWAGRAEVSNALRSAGIKLLHNQSERIFVNGNGPVEISSCDEPWGDVPWRPPRLDDGALNLVLTHTPDNIYRLSSAGFTAVFAGHYHAGQIRLPYIGPVVVPSRYGRRFDRGHFNVNGTHLFVTAGVGGIPPLRIYCRPDIFVVDFRGTGDSRKDDGVSA